MAELFIDSSTKGFTDMTAVSTAKSLSIGVDRTAASPALSKLLDALKQQANSKTPTEVVIGVFGDEQHVFSLKLDDLREIQEILEWTIGS